MIEIRRVFTSVEDIHHEFGPPPATPLRRGAIAVVLTNPYAGRYEPDILPMMDALQGVGLDMAERLRAAMGVPAERIQGYGKGAIIGTAGELEHGALWHAPGGHAMREALGDAKAIVPSSGKVAVAGARLDVPITHLRASYVRSHFDAIEVGVADAPRPDELVLILAMTTGGRIHARAGGLKASEIKGEDGLR
jgi:hypothetical protein